MIVIDHVTKIFGPDPSSMLPLIDRGLSRQQMLQTQGHVLALHDLSLSIHPGECFVVMGLSGSGKSTLIRHLNRLIEPTAGKVFIDGEDILRLNPAGLRDLRRYKVSMVFQRFGLLPHRSALENVAYGLRTAGMSRHQAQACALEQIERVGLSGYEHHFPGQLSGGMQQRVGLARALATEAPILLMDEPYSALDPVIRREMQQQLRQLQRELARTIVFITHDLDEALRLGDRIAILKDGELLQCAGAQEILLSPAGHDVDRFVRDVNRASVLTMGSIATPVAELSRAEASATTCILAMGGADAVVLMAGQRPVSMISESFARQHADRPGAWWSHTDSLPGVVTVDAGQTIEQGLAALAHTDEPVLVVAGDGRRIGAVSRRAAIRALAGWRDGDSG